MVIESTVVYVEDDGTLRDRVADLEDRIAEVEVALDHVMGRLHEAEVAVNGC